MSSPPHFAIRKLKLFIPPAQDPLLTTYGKFLLPKLSPMKQRLSIYSNRKQRSTHNNPQPQYLNAVDIDKINRSYEKFNRSKGVTIKLRQTQYHLDPLYKSIYDLKHKAEKNRYHSQRKSLIINDINRSYQIEKEKLIQSEINNKYS